MVGSSVGEVYGCFSIFFTSYVVFSTPLVAAVNKLRMVLSTVTAAWSLVHPNPEIFYTLEFLSQDVIRNTVVIFRAYYGPALVGRPIIFSCSGPRPDPAHQIFIRWVPARPGPPNCHRMGRGPARPINFVEDGPWPGPAHQKFRGGARPGPARHFFSEDGLRPGPAHRISNYIGRHGPSIFQNCRPGPARPMAFAARPMRHGIHMGRPVDLKSRPTGWPMCYPVLKRAH